MSFRVAKIHDDAIIPVKGSSKAAGFDVSSIENVIISPHSQAMIRTGISIQIPDDCYARIAPRSGLAAKNSIDVFAGVIDADYTGEIKVILYNHKDTVFEVKKGDRIAQMIFEKIYTPESLEEVLYETLDQTQRGVGGFGSTGTSTVA